MRRRLGPRLLAAGVAGAGLALVVLGALLATVWKAPTTASVTVPAAAGVPVLVTAPGALSLQAKSVRVTATAGERETPVFLGVGRSGDVAAFLGDTSRQVLAGVSADGAALVKREGSQAAGSDPARSDVWVASNVGQGAAQLTWPEQPGSWVLVASTAGAGSGPAQVTFTWPLPIVSSAAPTLIAIGGVLLVIGVVAFALIIVRAREDVQPYWEED